MGMLAKTSQFLFNFGISLKFGTPLTIQRPLDDLKI